MNELKVYEKQTTIYLYNWNPIITAVDKHKIAEAVNSWARLIEIDWDYIASNNVSYITSDRIGEVESFILNFDKDIQNRLRAIIKKREAENLKVNVEVLKNAYKSTFWKDIEEWF